MALEIERRFLVDPKHLSKFTTLGKAIFGQFYLSKPGDSCVVRIRVDYTNYKAFHTTKQHVSLGTNKEFEFEIPYEKAADLAFSNKDTVISKLRYIYPLGHLKFEIDRFNNNFEGLVVAEIELPSLDYKFDMPSFLGKEITGIKGLSNFSMAFEPEKAKEILRSLDYKI